MGSWCFSHHADSGSLRTILNWRSGLNLIVPQGTKVPEDHEVRRSFNVTAKGDPPTHTSARIAKYTGALATPKWEDAEPGRVFTLPYYPVKVLKAQKKSSRRCAISRQTSPALRVHHTTRIREERATGGIMK